ncbi:glycoside hydrolase family 43 protein [Paenibacillus sp. GD4]|uniref:glycoside hydrolase family 43 protein n=1 Tax=Paenibacillus sp. GD4 TaxID=3068890 RepID=UPI0027967997|nr:glycoside hydrolase family 43 protein [Paenibacillus sp. GD4]MDQ1913875.1 glycoside hydrolase family 43 protein [Paenibacillus sp. GD4]
MYTAAACAFLVAILLGAQLQWGKKETNRMAVTLSQTYENPFVLSQEWEDYGIGDPYILRYDGKYYLYCSTKDRRVGIKAWSSDDLVNWHYEGLVTEEPVSTGAYAPEVVYWNGSFYMYTSPAGKGHYVLQSDKPTGPFVKKTDNLGLTIDGSVFIDDDGKWYFTHAKFDGIMASTMSDPYSIDPGKQLNTSLGHWTEGSMIIKRNGRYFMTYTGNHVFSTGYRVNYGVNRESPIGAYTIPENNPILISTANDFNGLGHSATVMGPDLDSYYIVYHNLVGRSAEGPPVRRMNLDRLVFNGDKMSVLGPTHGAPQEAPRLPDFRDVPGEAPSEVKWERTGLTEGVEALLARTETDGRFTAEYNFRLGDAAAGGRTSSLDAVFAYEDSGSYRAARVDEAKMELVLIDQVNGVETAAARKPLPKGTDLTKLHAIRIESDSTGTKLFWDGLLQIEQSSLAAKPGRIGYAWPQGGKPELRYTAFSNDAGGSSDGRAMKPLPGAMEAVHGVREGNPVVRTGITPDGSDAVVLPGKGDGLAFPVNLRQDGTYLLSVNAAKTSAGSTLEIEINGVTKQIKLDPALFASGAEWTKVPLGEFGLKQGPAWLSLRRVKGEITLRYVEASLTAAVPEQSVIKPTSVGVLNRFGGDAGWTDYTVSFDVTLKEATTEEIGILLRTTHESEFKDQVKDAFMGYSLSFRSGRVALTKVSYEKSAEQASASLAFTPGQTRRFTVKLKGASLAVFDGDGKEPMIKWTDPNAFLLGRVGLKGVSTAWTISPLTVTRD